MGVCDGVFWLIGEGEEGRRGRGGGGGEGGGGGGGGGGHAIMNFGDAMVEFVQMGF